MLTFVISIKKIDKQANTNKYDKQVLTNVFSEYLQQRLTNGNKCY